MSSQITRKPHRLLKIDANDPSVQKRKCLKCHGEFISAWVGNRICLDCKPSFKHADDGCYLEHGVSSAVTSRNDHLGKS